MFTEAEYKLHWSSIIDMIDSYTKNELKDMVQYQFKNPGKGFRSLLAIHLCETFTIPSSKIYPLCAAIELIHNASLVHDDIEDNDEYRRGMLAAWKKFGISNAINLGDYLFTMAFEIVSQKSPLFVDMLSASIKTLVEGQIREINANSFELDGYLEIARKKSGALFTLPLLGAYKLKESTIDMQPLIAFGYNIGEIYQLRDDIIDMIGQKEGRPKYSDIREGRFSILNILTYANIEDKNNFRTMLGGNKDNLLKLYKKHSALEKAYDLHNEKVLELKNRKIYFEIKPVMDVFLTKLSLPLMNDDYYGH